MRNVFILCYDIACDKRRQRVADTCKGYGERIQYSVFRCPISRTERVQLESTLRGMVHHTEDQVLFIDLGPIEGRGAQCISALGKRFDAPTDGPTIL